MASPHEQQWWPSIVEGLKDRPLADLAEEHGVTADELTASLAAVSHGGRAEEEPWWPEARRLVAAGGAIRETARRFGVEPRRLRRALTRNGVRAGGMNVGEQGIEALVAFRDRLGKEPDGAIAREAGITVEAVQGERRRLSIPAYRVRPDEEEWNDEPPPPPIERPRGRRRWDELPVPEVIRRKSSGADPRSPETGPGIALAPRSPGRGPSPMAVGSAPAAITPAPVQPAPSEVEPPAESGPADGGSLPRRRLVRPAVPVRIAEPAPPQPRPRLPRPVAPPVRIILERPAPPPEPPVPPPDLAFSPPALPAAQPESLTSVPDDISLPPEADTLLPVPARRSSQPRRAPDQAWQVDLPDLEEPLFVRAASLREAVEIAARHLGRSDLSLARAWRIGPLWE